ncbi:MAG: hypothetical protein JW723_01105 [Bacteroidales bacterium]|nr:hypothetical protein [Bacteroidales bacterium]
MALPSFFKINKHREFHYNPIFYDKEKEEFNERVSRIEQEMGIKNDVEFRSGIKRGAMREYIQRSRKQDRYSSIRLVIIFIFLLALVYLILFR